MTTISALPTAPSRADPATFSDRSDALLGALDTFVTETNTVAGEVNTNAATATTQAALATTNGAAQVALAAAQVALATTQATNAANSATSAATSALTAGAVAWVSGTTYATGDVRYSPINFQAYRRKTNGGGTTDPSLDSTNWTKALLSGVSDVATATTATTLTSTGTLLQITPASYGVAVTLPDATTCTEGGPMHIIDNKGDYPVKVLNSAGTLLGFVYGGVVSHVSLIDNSTAAGTWTIENNELVGASAQLLTTNMALIDAVIDIGSSQEVIIGRGVSSANCYGVVYNRSTNTFGSVTLIRTATFGSRPIAACLSGTNQVLVCSVATGATSFEAVALSISGTTITVNTAATATLSASISSFADGCGLIAVGSSFVCSYTVATPAAQIRALSISGTTVTIGSATVLDGTAGGLIAASSDKVIAVSTGTTHLYTKPYLVSGSTLTAGTGTDDNNCTALYKFAAIGSRWVICGMDGTSSRGYIISLNASGNGTTTSSSATLFSAGTLLDAIIVGSTKVLALNNQTSNNANILTDTAGTASAGTAITLDSGTARCCLYVSGTDVFVSGSETSLLAYKVNCSATNPSVSAKYVLSAAHSQDFAVKPSNSVLSRSGDLIFGTEFAQTLSNSGNTTSFLPRMHRGVLSSLPRSRFISSGGPSHTGSRGISHSERWIADGSTLITKLECVA